MKPFNLEEYLKNPSRKIITKEGRNVRIICTDRVDPAFQIVALIESKWGESIIANTKDGKYFLNDASDCDLFFAPEKHEGWTLFIKCDKSLGLETLDSKIYYTREEAQRMRETHPGRYGAIVKLEWEE